MTIKIDSSKSNLLLTAVYWPPDSDEQPKTIKEFQTLFEGLGAIPSNHRIVAGDLNLRNVHWELTENSDTILEPQTQASRTFERPAIESIDEFDFSQLNQRPNQNGRFLDLFLSTQPEHVTFLQNVECGLLLIEDRHHTPTAYEISLEKNAVIDEPKFTMKSRVDHRRLSGSLATIQPLTSNTIDDTRRAINEFVAAIRSATVTQKVKLPSYAIKHPWLANSAGYRKIIFKIRRAKRIPNNQTQIRELNISLRSKYHQLRDEYFASVVGNLSGDKRELFDLLRFKKTDRNAMPKTMESNSIPFEGDSRFVAMATHLTNAFGPADPELYAGNPDANMDTLWQSAFRPGVDWSIFGQFSETAIESAIKSLDIRKDSGPMQIAASTIKNHSNKISSLLAPIFTSCATNGWIPDDWKEAFITPVPKKGDAKNVANYRGICMSSVLPKLFDKILSSQIEAIWDVTFADTQHGFRKKRGTHTALLEATQFINMNLNYKTRIDALFVDFEKCFDRISHAVIVKKLAAKGAPLSAIRTIMQLVMRRQYVLKFDGTVTSVRTTPQSAVPQGSHIGPILFTIVADDLNTIIDDTDASIIQYADDLLLLQINRGMGTEGDSMQRAITNLSAWSDANKFSVNAGKTKLVTFTKRAFDFDPEYDIGGVPIERVDEITYLGVIFDKRFIFNTQINEVSAKSLRLANAASRLARYVGNRSLNMILFNIYNDPTINYSSFTWNNGQAQHERTINAGHRRATICALGSGWRPHLPNYLDYETRCKRLNVLPLKRRQNVLAAGLAAKLLRGEVLTPLAIQFNEALYVPRERDRNVPPLFAPYILPKKSPVGRLSQSLENLKSGIDLFNESIATIKKKLKKNETDAFSRSLLHP